MFFKSKINPWASFEKLHESLILNIFSYCIQVRGLKYLNMLESAHLAFYKNILNIPKNTPHYAVRLESGALLIKYTIFKDILNWIEKLSKLKNDRHLKLSLLKIIQIAHQTPEYTKNWVLPIKLFFLAISREQDDMIYYYLLSTH